MLPTAGGLTPAEPDQCLVGGYCSAHGTTLAHTSDGTVIVPAGVLRVPPAAPGEYRSCENDPRTLMLTLDPEIDRLVITWQGQSAIAAIVQQINRPVAHISQKVD